jgi:Transglutaminase-like superfamily
VPNRLSLAGLLLVAAAAVAQDRPRTTVIAPQAPPVPDKPGYIVIRPMPPATPPAGSGPVMVSPPQPAPTPTPTTPRPDPFAPGAPTPVPVPTPTPVDDTPPAAKPAKPDDGEKGTIVLETWDTAYLKGQKVGHFHVVVREYERDGKKYVYATKEQRLTVARFGQVVEQWAEDSTLEQPDGQVLVTRMAQGLSREQKLSLTGKVDGRTLKVTGDGPAAGAQQEVPWPEGVLGIAKEATLYKTKKPTPGDTFDYTYYEGRLNRVVKVTVTAKAVETVAIIAGEKPRKLLRLVAATDPIKLANGGEFKMPPSTIWADPESFEPLRTDSDMPSLGGKLVVLRTSKEIALRPPGKVPDLFDVQSIRLDREIPGIHDLPAMTYRFKSGEDAEFSTAVPSDARQKVGNPTPDGKGFDLTVTAVRQPKADAADPGAEFLGTSFFVDWDTPEVRRHAAAAVATLPAGATAWDKAKAVERYVHSNMRSVEFSQAMATASQVAKTLSGDCTEYAMLAAALCRANGVPSRTALGLVYAPGRDGRPFLAYHMWFEVHAGGWVALDATLGRGSVGPGHVKITDASWHNERSFAPLLPVLRVLMAQPTVEVVR